MLQHAHGCGFLIKKCDVKGGEGGGGQKVNVIVTLRSAKVVWKCPLSKQVTNFLQTGFLSPSTFPEAVRHFSEP